MKMAIDVTENMSCHSDLQLQSFNSKLGHSPTFRLFPSSAILKQKKSEILEVSKRVQEQKCKRSETKVEEEYCWAITQAEGLSGCDPSDSSVMEFGFKLDFLIHVCAA
jgi:hypothetical protein